MEDLILRSPHDNGQTYFLMVLVPSTRNSYLVVAAIGLNAYDQSQVFEDVKVLPLEAHSNKHGIATPTYQNLATIAPDDQEYIKNVLTECGYYSEVIDYEQQAAGLVVSEEETTVKAYLYCYSETTGKWLPAKDPNCGWCIDPKFWVVECHHIEDWGSPVGGVVPCDEEGNEIKDTYTSGFDVAYFEEEY